LCSRAMTMLKNASFSRRSSDQLLERCLGLCGRGLRRGALRALAALGVCHAGTAVASDVPCASSGAWATS
jgi:ABC-type phosphate/phosphonate transport system ATPase subunit